MGVEGGGFKNIVRGVTHGVKRLWYGAHQDQRLSWIGHYIVCVVISLLGVGLVAVLTAIFKTGSPSLILIYAMFATALFGYFMLREAGDEDYHRNVAKDWRKLDNDTKLSGKKAKGVTAEYDKIGDLTGPGFNCLTAWILWGLSWL